MGTEGVEDDVFAVEGRAVHGRCVEVFCEAAFESVAAESAAVLGWEERIVGSAGAFVEPDAQDGDGDGGQWCDALLAAFAAAADVRPGW